MVAVVVLPFVVNALGVLVTVHAPAGRLLSTTLPVATVQVGWVMVPITGFNGVTSGELITTSAVGKEIQPTELATVNVYVPVARPLIVVEGVLPVVIIPPGLRVSVQVPDGKSLNTTEPVATEQDGWVMLTKGVEGLVFGALIPLPASLVQPLTVVVTAKVPAVLTLIELVDAPVLHRSVPAAVVDKVEVPSQ